MGSSGGSGDTNFDTPAQVAVDSSENTYTADTVNDRIIKRDSNGAFVSSLTGIDAPSGVAVDSGGNVYVSYGVLGQIRKYNGAFALQWTSSIDGNVARHLCTDGTHLYIVDADIPQINKRLCSTGAAVATWGSAGSGDGQFNDAYGICTDGTNVYVVDRGNSRVQKFTMTGTFVTKWGTVGSGDGQFTTPRGIAVDDSGDIWVADFGNDRMQRFSNAGVFQTKFTQADPDGIDVATGDVVWVSNAVSDNITKWDEVATTVGRSWDAAVGGEANGSLNIDVANGASGDQVETIGSKWYAVNSRESVDIAAWCESSSSVFVPRLRLIFADEDGTTVQVSTEATWAPVASTEYRRVFATRVPDRATQYRIALVAYASAAFGGSSAQIWFDDVTVNDNELIVTDAGVLGGGAIQVTVALRGRWL